MRHRGLEIMLVLILFGGAAAMVSLLLPGPAPAAVAWEDPGATDPPAPPPTATPPSAPTRTAQPTVPGMPTTTPQPTTLPGMPTTTPEPVYEYVVDVAVPVPPEPIPFPWVGVVDFLRRNVCVTHGGNTACQGDWIVNTNASLYENRALRVEPVRANLVSQGDKLPENPADDVHIPRPQCLVNGEWTYVPGAWYYNGLSEVVVEDEPYDKRLVHYGRPQYPVEFDVLIRYHRAYVPEPTYPGRTAWNFGALGECNSGGGGGGGSPPPPPPPPPTPHPPPAECPACFVNVMPAGTFDAPYLTPWQSITLTWNCQAETGNPSGYIVRVYTPWEQGWSVRYRYELPESTRRQVLPVEPGLLYRAEVTAVFDVDGTSTECCFGETYYRYYQELPPGVGSLEARVEYWSEHDPDYPHHGPDNPYRTTGPFLKWNYGETLHVHPTAELVEPSPPPGWMVQTTLLKWRYRGSATDEWHPAHCDPPDAASCGWFEELPRQYIHLRWFRHLMPGETEGVAVGDTGAWAYATDPTTVTLAYQVQAETMWTNTQTGYQLTWPAFTSTLTVTVDLQYPATYRGGR